MTNHTIQLQSLVGKQFIEVLGASPNNTKALWAMTTLHGDTSTTVFVVCDNRLPAIDGTNMVCMETRLSEAIKYYNKLRV